MIGRLRGIVLDRRGETVMLDVGGVGYLISVTPRALADLPCIGAEAVLHTHLHVREDQLSLYGFTTREEKELFGSLLGVQGVGPKVAAAILATMTYEQLGAAVASDDVAALTSVPGIGKKSAQKLMIELKSKMDALDEPLAGIGPVSEVREALEGLGYSMEEIRGALAAMPREIDVEELLRRSLQYLGKVGN